jgi:hypothetical protein
MKDEPDALADLGHADALTGEDVTQIHLAPAEADCRTRDWSAPPPLPSP